MLTKRVIACLDVLDGRVVKGVRFREHKDMGDFLTLAARYRDQGADELVFYDIAASADQKSVRRDWVRLTAKALDIPFCVAGGIRSVEDAEEVLNAGADKISINSPALERPALITELARRFGSQCVVVGVDSRVDGGAFKVYQYTGRAEKTRDAGLDLRDWLKQVQELGAGEVVLNCMDRDGTGEGYDLEQLKAARAVLTVPLVASGGAKTPSHFADAYAAGADAALAAGIFHRGELTVGQVKAELKARGLPVRPTSVPGSEKV